MIYRYVLKEIQGWLSSRRPGVYKLYFLDVGLASHATSISRIDPKRLHSQEFINSGRLAEELVGAASAVQGTFRGTPFALLPASPGTIRKR